MSCYQKIVVVGSGMLAYQIAAYLRKQNISIAILEKAAGTPSRIGTLCEKQGMDYHFLPGADLSIKLASYMADPVLIISAVNMYIFPKQIVNHRNVRIINYHNALLPRHRGVHAEAWQIFGMEDVAGVTWHDVNEQIDDGHIIAQETIPLDDSITSVKLLKRQNTLAYDLFLGFYARLLDGELTGRPQPPDEARTIHYAKDIPNNGQLDTDWSYERISAFLRALDYGALKMLGDGHIRLCGKTYTWSGYALCPRDTGPEGIVLLDGNITIHRESGSVLLKQCVEADVARAPCIGNG